MIDIAREWKKTIFLHVVFLLANTAGSQKVKHMAEKNIKHIINAYKSCVFIAILKKYSAHTIREVFVNAKIIALGVVLNISSRIAEKEKFPFLTKQLVAIEAGIKLSSNKNKKETFIIDATKLSIITCRLIKKGSAKKAKMCKRWENAFIFTVLRRLIFK